ncbi:hypothetical protein JOL62DRAFT_578252 [Phyllosticta paracitricarpa]|uniref:Uncharacterized protein n=2 Tax=Phyllosticta TaxID=121621 RepID=A0ABR1N6J9_9PEZI
MYCAFYNNAELEQPTTTPMARQLYHLTALAWRRAPVLPPRAVTRLQSFHSGPPNWSVFKSNGVRRPKVPPLYEQAPELEEFKQLATMARDTGKGLDKVVDQYARMAENRLIHSGTTTLLAQMIHTRFRLLGPDMTKTAATMRFFNFADRLVEDLHADKIWPSPIATLRLISMAKEAKDIQRGKAYWAKLVEKEGATDSGAYGSYIELLAEEGKVPLSDLEALYQEALDRNPETFAAYHLSHNAILPDRRTAARFPGMSAHLLQGIIAARLRHGDWRNAYLGLDTAFRIWGPQVPTRILILFRFWRPVPESLRVFIMSCWSGCQLSSRDYVLQTSVSRDLLRNAPVEERGRIILDTLDALYAFIGSGGQVVHHATTLLMKNMEALVPSPYYREPQHQSAADLIARTAREVYEEFSNAGVKTRLITLAARLHLVGKTLNAQELGIAMKEMKELRAVENSEPGSLERNVLLAAGKIKHRDLIVEAWSDLQNSLNGGILASDWACLAVACRDGDYKQYFFQEFAKAKDIKKSARDVIMKQLDWDFMKSGKPKHEPLPLDATQAIVDAIKARVKAITDLVRSKKALDFNTEPVLGDIGGVQVGTQEAMRQVYDRLTTDPLAPRREGHLKPLMTPTGIPLEEVRFRNWVAITEMLKHAEMLEKYMREREGAQPWIRPPPELLQPPIEDPDELLEEVKRLRGIEEVSKPPEI